MNILELEPKPDGYGTADGIRLINQVELKRRDKDMEYRANCIIDRETDQMSNSRLTRF